MPLRIAMWSGPRNISTALMRSFGSRGDTAVCDEPLYAHYLARRPVAHPGRAEIVARCETDWRKVAAFLTGPVPDGKAVFYQKHMAHHLLPEVGRAWMDELVHGFLIRDPREMLLSLARVMPDAGALDTGLPQQLELFREVERRTGCTPPVVDARDVLSEPAAVLAKLCAALGLEFTPAMLRWEPGLRATDGIWAEHWYADVARSTGFEGWRPRAGELAGRLAEVHAECLGPYRELWAQRLTA
jgi:sulfotransferase family protein